jgi:hypothetical protein
VGTSSVTKNTATLFTDTYKVKPLPDPKVFLGGKADGESVNKAVTNIQVKYGSDITLTGVTFQVSSWKLTGSGRTANGSGSDIGGNAEAAAIMKNSSGGKYVTLFVTFKKPDKTVKTISSTYKVN